MSQRAQRVSWAVMQARPSLSVAAGDLRPGRAVGEHGGRDVGQRGVVAAVFGAARQLQVDVLVAAAVGARPARASSVCPAGAVVRIAQPRSRRALRARRSKMRTGAEQPAVVAPGSPRRRRRRTGSCGRAARCAPRRSGSCCAVRGGRPAADRPWRRLRSFEPEPDACPSACATGRLPRRPVSVTSGTLATTSSPAVTMYSPTAGARRQRRDQRTR